MAPVPEQGPRARPIAQAPVLARQNPVHRLIRTREPQNQTFRILFARKQCPVTTQILPGEYLLVDMFVYTHTDTHPEVTHFTIQCRWTSSAPGMDVKQGEDGWAWLIHWVTQCRQASSLGRGLPALTVQTMSALPLRPLGTLQVQVPCGHTVEAGKAAGGRDPCSDPHPPSPEPRKPR